MRWSENFDEPIHPQIPILIFDIVDSDYINVVTVSRAKSAGALLVPSRGRCFHGEENRFASQAVALYVASPLAR